jgi:aminopeptidase N
MRFLVSLLSLAVLTVAVSRCTHNEVAKDSKTDAPTNYVTASSLTQNLAETRAHLVHDVKYDLEITLDKTQDTYSGVQKINFQLAKVTGDLPLDFQEGEIQSAVVNGHLFDMQAEKIQRGPLFVILPAAQLKSGENTVEIKFTHPYSHNGVGLHRYLDAEDKSVYLYTQFEPFDANRFAPFFDQPDIKANMTLTVHAPQDWLVITNTNETSLTKSENSSRWQFGMTPKLSTYLFALIAGPYVQFDGHYKEKKMRLFARKTMAKYVDAKDWLKITEQGLAFYEDYFKVPYPFEKFDQIFVPEFNAGAMENSGAVTFTERYIRRAGYTRSNKASMYGTLLHEMAHQWFGDLVTMRWWNDLWLNESFATAMSMVSEVAATEYKEAPNMFVDSKASAYREDEMITTHPISAVIKDTNSSYTNFDRITYSKGASVLRELYFYVGDETFRKALHYYFTQHAYQNTGLSDFIAAFNETTKTDMTSWFTDWLSTSGIDEIATTYSCNAEGVNVQVHNLSKTPRIHSLRIGRYHFADGKVIFDGATDYRTMKPDGEFTVPTDTTKMPCPDMIYANVDDQAYVKLLLDDKSVKFLQVHVNDIPDLMLRQLVWADLWQMVRDQKFKLADFTAMAMRALQIENNPDILRGIAARAIGSGYSDFDNVYYYWPRTTEDEKRTLADLKRNFAQVLWSRLTHEQKGSDLEKLFTDFYLRSVGEETQLSRLQKMVKTLKDQDRRWSLLNAMCKIGATECLHLVDLELKHDKSDVAQKSAIGCRAARPDEGTKREFLTQLAADKSPFPTDISRSVTFNLFPAAQRDLIPSFADQIYKDFTNVWVLKRDEGNQSYLAMSLAPVFCDPTANSKLDSTLHGEGAMWPSTVRKPMLEVWDEDSRCIKVRRFNSKLGASKIET